MKVDRDSEGMKIEVTRLEDIKYRKNGIEYFDGVVTIRSVEELLS